MRRLADLVSRREVPLLAAAALLAVALRLAYAAVGVSPQLTDDETSFWAVAGAVVDGRGFAYEGAATAWRPPLYTLAVAGLRAAGLDVRGVQVVQAAVGAATPVLLWATVRRLRAPAWAAVGAAAVAAAYPPFVHLASQVLSENASIPLLALAVWATVGLLQAEAPGWRAATATGVAWGLATLARPAALPGFALACVALLPARRWRQRVPAVLALGLAGALTLAPWTVRNALEVGGPVPVVSNEGFTLWVSNRLDAEDLKDVFRDPEYPGLEDYGVYGRAFPGIVDVAAADGFDFPAASEADRDAWFRDRVRADLLADPARFVGRSAARTVAVLSPAPENASREEETSPAAAAVLWLTSGPVVVVGLAGVVVLALRAGRAGRFLAGTAVVSLIGVATHLPYVRYRVGAVDPLLIVAAAWLLAGAARPARPPPPGGRVEDRG